MSLYHFEGQELTFHQLVTNKFCIRRHYGAFCYINAYLLEVLVMILTAWSIVEILGELSSLGVPIYYKIFDILKIFLYQISNRLQFFRYMLSDLLYEVVFYLMNSISRAAYKIFTLQVLLFGRGKENWCFFLLSEVELKNEAV